MSRGARMWLAVAVVFVVVNLLGVGWAIGRGEVVHACIHGVLALVGAVPVWWLAVRGTRARQGASEGEARIAPRRDDLADRLARLEQSVDSVAIEVERIGEGQRYVTRLFTERGRVQDPGEGATGRDLPGSTAAGTADGR